MSNFLTEPYLVSLNPSTEMNVVWILKTPKDGFVEFGKDETLGKIIKATCYEIKGLRAPHADGTYGETPEGHEKVSAWQYIAKIDGLTDGEKIFYRVRSGNDISQIYFFRSAPRKGEKFKFSQMSDLQGLPDCHKTVYKIGLHHPDLILYSGDMTYISWRLDQWFDTKEPWQSDDTRKHAFFPCMQQQNGARLMQYCPFFLCPGNHEVDDLRTCTDIKFSQIDRNWNWSIFMQMFRPLYDVSDTTLTGKRWYSVDYADMHIVSLNINRIYWWDPYQAPGWRIYDSIDPHSPQILWLKDDLTKNDNTFTWVIQHFHILNKGNDVQFNLCAPVLDGKGGASYPHDHGGELMDLYQKGGVNAVSFGHSHVYERYFTKDAHYIEAAYMSVCFRKEGALPHPSGLLPIVENNSARSFIIVDRNQNGLFATAYFADTDEIFDEYQIADENGKTVPPKR